MFCFVYVPYFSPCYQIIDLEVWDWMVSIKKLLPSCNSFEQSEISDNSSWWNSLTVDLLIRCSVHVYENQIFIVFFFSMYTLHWFWIYKMIYCCSLKTHSPQLLKEIGCSVIKPGWLFTKHSAKVKIPQEHFRKKGYLKCSGECVSWKYLSSLAVRVSTYLSGNKSQIKPCF